MSEKEEKKICRGMTVMDEPGMTFAMMKKWEADHHKENKKFYRERGFAIRHKMNGHPKLVPINKT